MFCCQTRSARSSVCNLNAMVRHLLVRNILAGAARHVAGRTILLLRVMAPVRNFAPVVAAQAVSHGNNATRSARRFRCFARVRIVARRARHRVAACPLACALRAAPHTATSPFPPAPPRPGATKYATLSKSASPGRYVASECPSRYAAVSPSRWHCRHTESLSRRAPVFAGFSTGALPFVRTCSVASPWQDAQPIPPCANGAAAK